MLRLGDDRGRLGNSGNKKCLALCLDLIAIRLVFWLEIEILVGWTKKHLTIHCEHLHTEELVALTHLILIQSL